MYKYVFLLFSFNFFVEHVSADCAPGCLDGWQSDGECDLECFNAACNWDGDDVCYGMSGDDDFLFHNDDNDDIWTGECSISSCPGVHQGHCGVFAQETDKWCDMGGTEVCCAENSDDCCETNGGAIAGIVIGIIVLIGVCCYFCCNCNNNNNNNKEYGEPPYCCFKFWCPPCAVCSHQGCDEPCDVIMSLWLGCLFTLCCWYPKTKTYVAPPNGYIVNSNNDNNNNNNIEITSPPEYVSNQAIIPITSVTSVTSVTETNEIINKL